MTVLFALAIPFQVKSQEEERPKAHNFPHYSITDLGTLGGRFSLAVGLNNQGVVVASSNLSGNEVGGNQTVHVFRWHDGAKTNLGTLGGPQSIVGFNNPINNSGVITGNSNISTPDPNGEDFCGIGFTLICLPFVWQKGVMTALPLLGGNNGLAGGINSRGQIVGVAETAVTDPCSFAFLQVEAVIWQNGQVEELPPFPGDSIGNAIANNDKGEVVGATGCQATNTVRAVLWPDGPNGGVIDLGNLGSGAFNLAFGINNRSQIVGQSPLPDNTLHAFLWQDGVMNDLGSLPGLPGSEANGINDHGQVVGFSFDANGDESSNVAWIWEKGTMTDLNNLAPADSPWFLMEALGINDRGQIAGKMFNLMTGDIHGFLATPVRNKQSDGLVEANHATKATTKVPSASVRETLRHRLSVQDNRFHGWPTRR
jgi:probable HAF family extracellular repeat protein